MRIVGVQPIPSEEEILTSWRDRGLECRICAGAPGEVDEDLVSTADTTILLLQGDLEMEVDEEFMRPQVGEEVTIPAGTMHALRIDELGPARFVIGESAR